MFLYNTSLYVTHVLLNYLLNFKENQSSQITPDLPCIISGVSTISFSIANYLTTPAPSWITINPSSGILSIIAPDVAVDCSFLYPLSPL